MSPTYKICGACQVLPAQYRNVQLILGKTNGTLIQTSVKINRPNTILTPTDIYSSKTHTHTRACMHARTHTHTGASMYAKCIAPRTNIR